MILGALLISRASIAQAQNRILDIGIYYISKHSQPNVALEQKINTLIGLVEKRVNQNMLKRPETLRFRIAFVRPWDHPNIHIAFQETPWESMVFQSILAHLNLPPIQKSSNLYIILVPNHFAVCAHSDSKAAEQCAPIQALGAADRGDGEGNIIAISNSLNAPAEELSAKFFHELGHIVGLPDEIGEICLNMPSYIMCDRTDENQTSPTFTRRYTEAVRALWLLRALSDNNSKP